MANARNRRFFHELSPLAAKLQQIDHESRMAIAPKPPVDKASALGAAQDKRERRAARNRALAEKQGRE